MSVLRLRPRGDQIEALTRGQAMPLARLPAVHLEIISEYLQKAWLELVSEHDSIHSLDEAEINSHLEIKLNGLVYHDTMFGQLVSCVARGKETVSFDGTHLEKRPDLSFYLTNNHPSFPLLAECKILDTNSSKGVDLYCSNGIHRFISGQYSWANAEAFMVAYVRDGSKLTGVLSPYLTHQQTLTPDPYLTLQVPAGSAAVLSSAHGRNFTYAHGSNAGTINIWHVWLDQPLANQN